MEVKNIISSLFLIFLFFYGFAQETEPQIVLNSQGHSARIRALHFTSDGNQLISAGEDKSIHFWQTGTGELNGKFYTQMDDGPEGMIYSSALHPDGEMIAIAGYPVDEINPEGSYFITYNIITQKQTGIYPAHEGIITNIEFSKDGRLLATADENGEILIWKVSGDNIFEKAGKIHVGSVVSDIDFAYHKSLLAVTFDSKYFHLYDLTRINVNFPVEPFKVVEKHYYPVRSVAFSPDSVHLVTGGEDHLVNLFSVDGKFRQKIDEMPDPVTDIDFSKDGKILVACAENSGLARSYTIPGFAKMADFPDHNNTITACTFYPVVEEGNYLLATAGGNDNEIFLWNPLNGRINEIFSGKGTAIWDIAFTEDLKLLVSNNRNAERFEMSFDFQNLVLEDVAGMRIASLKTHEGGIVKTDDYSLKLPGGNVIFNDPQVDGRILSFLHKDDQLYVGSDFSLKVYDLSGKLISELVGHQGGIRSLSVSINNQYLASGGEDQVVHLWSTKFDEEKSEPFVSLFITKDKEWVCWTPSGYFGCSDLGPQYFGWYVQQETDEIGDFYTADQYFDVLYRPEDVKRSILDQIPVSRLMQEMGENIFDLTKLDKPSVALFESPYASVGQDRSIYLNKTKSKYYVSDQREVVLNVSAYDGGGGIKELRVYHNDKLVAMERDVSISQDRQKIEKEFELLLLPGGNQFKVTAVNYQMIESRPDEIIVEYTGELEATSDLYIFAIGVNKYMNNNYDLNYARPDAESFLDAIAVRSKGIFNTIHTEKLFDEEVTADKIREVFEKISNQAKLTDVFIFYYAGHGTIDQQSENREYYLVPYDVVQLYGNSQELRSKGISASELRDMLADVKAQKQLILLDACHSGGAVQALAMRGAPEEKAIMQLARSSGIVLISASGTKQFATEFETLKHGAFTYVLLEALKGNADGGNQDQKITVNELKAYMEDRVPQVTSEYGGSMQFPTGFSTGQDFPISVVINQ